jgi:hypothetical protein
MPFARHHALKDEDEHDDEDDFKIKNRGSDELSHFPFPAKILAWWASVFTALFFDIKVGQGTPCTPHEYFSSARSENVALP